jgi:hypothetical protein
LISGHKLAGSSVSAAGIGTLEKAHNTAGTMPMAWISSMDA